MSARIAWEILWPHYTGHPISLLQLQETSYAPKAASDLLVTAGTALQTGVDVVGAWQVPPKLLHLPCPWQRLLPRMMGLIGFSSNTETFPWGKLPADFFLSPAGKIATILPDPASRDPTLSCACRHLHSARMEFPQKAFPAKTLMFCIHCHLV